MARASFTVLIADDSTDDVALLVRALRNSAEIRLVGVLQDGDQVIDYFEGRGKYQDRRSHPIPDALLLDLRMPRKSGFEALAHLRAKGLPLPKSIIILTTHAAPAEILRARELGAQFIDQKQPDYRPVLQRLSRRLRLEDEAAP